MEGVGVFDGTSGVTLGVGELVGVPSVTVAPETTMFTEKGWFACGPIPKSAPLVFLIIQLL